MPTSAERPYALDEPGSAGPGTLRNSVVVAAVIVGLAGGIIIAGRVPLPPDPSFTLVHATVNFVVSLVTAFLLFGQFLLRRLLSYLVLATAFLFGSLVNVPFLLSFPGALDPAGSLIGESQSAIWAWHLWHILFPALIGLSVIVHRRGAVVPRERLSAAVAGAVAAATLLVVAILAAVTLFHDQLPVLYGETEAPLTAAFYVTGAIAALVTVSALVLTLPEVRQRTVLHIWMALVLLALLADVGASLGSSDRYTVGWYFGRAEGSLASTVLFFVLAANINRLSRALTETAERLRVAVDEKDRALEEVRRRVREFEMLTENSTDIISRFDRSLRRVYVNRAIEALLGRSRDGLIGKTHLEMGLPPAVAETLDRELRLVLADGQPRETEAIVPTPKGERCIEARLVPEFDEQGVVQSVLTITRDITERKRIEAALRRREQEFEALVERSPDIVTRVDRHRRVIYANPAVERLTGKPRSQFLHTRPEDRGLPRQEAQLRARVMQEVIETGEERVVEHTNPSPTGTRHFQSRLVPEFGPDGKVESVIAIARDITDLKKAQEVLRQQSLADPLTGIGNRRYLEKFLSQEWRREARHRHPVAAIMADIDFFKAYNDHHGHPQGDECLREIADVFRQAVHRPGDTLVRYGGEEFAVLLPETDLRAAHEMAERLRRAVESRRIPHGSSPVAEEVTVSFGVAAVNAHERAFRDLIAAADAALYEAKAKGRNRVEVSDGVLVLH